LKNLLIRTNSLTFAKSDPAQGGRAFDSAGIHSGHTRRLAGAGWFRTFAVALAVASFFASAVVAQTVNFATWTSPGSFPLTNSVPLYTYSSTANGTLILPSGVTASLGLSGEIIGSDSSFDNSSNWIWTIAPSGTYTSDAVPSLPPTNHMIFLAGYSQGTQVLSFSAPIRGLFFVINSLGEANTPSTWRFTEPFQVLSGSGPYSVSQDCDNIVGTYCLTGTEFSGVVVFPGQFSNLTWVATVPEYGVGWTIGVTSAFDEPTCGLGGVETLSQGGWGNGSTWGSLPSDWISSNFGAAIQLGGGNRIARFTTPEGVRGFLPNGGGSRALPVGNVENPTSRQIKSSLAGQTLALMLNMAAHPGFAGGVIQSGSFEGATVASVVTAANSALGGAAVSQSELNNLARIAEELNLSFSNGSSNGFVGCPIE
jgi:hypothetical protein